MNVFSKVTLRGLKLARTRTVVTIIGVILSASMITAVTTFVSSLQNYLVQTAIANTGEWEVYYQGVPYAFAEKVSADDMIKDTYLVEFLGAAALGEYDADSLTPLLPASAFTEKAFEQLPVELISGGLPQNENEIVIPTYSDFAWEDYALGDSVTIVYPHIAAGETAKTYTVAGFCKPGGFGSFITKSDDENKDGLYDVYVKMNNSRKVYEFNGNHVSEYIKELNMYESTPNYNRDYLKALGISSNENFNAVLYSFASILIALIMVGSVLLIYNSFSISVSERTRQFGILSSVGATRKQLRKSVLTEGVFIGAIGIPLGILSGIAGIGVTLEVVGDIFMALGSLKLTLSISPLSIIIAVVIGIITIFISAYIPAAKAAKISAIDSIRQSKDIKINPKSVKTSKLTEKLFGLPGILASKNFKRNKKRNRSTIISLFISVVLFISAGAFGMYLNQSVSTSLNDANFDILYTGVNQDEQTLLSLFETFKNMDGVTQSGYQASAQYRWENIPKDIFNEHYLKLIGADANGEWNFSTDMNICFIQNELYNDYIKMLNLPLNEYTGDGAKFPAIAGERRYEPELKRVISVALFNKNELSFEVNPYREVRTDNTVDMILDTDCFYTLSVTLTDKMPEEFTQSQYSGITVFAPYSAKERFGVVSQNIERFNMAFKADSPSELEKEMLDVLEEKGLNAKDYGISNAAAYYESNRRVILIINIFVYGFITLMSLITVANVFNTVSTNINLRRREFAMLKSVGMTDGGLNKMMNYECLFYGINSLVFGLPVSFGITWLSYHSVIEGIDVPFGLPWDSVGLAVFGVFAIVFITMLYSISKVKKTNTVDALREDM